MRITKNILKKSIVFALTALVVGVYSNKAFAACTPIYGGGETCVVTTRFRIEKWVRLEGDNSWRDEVTIDLDDDDENDKRILFKIQVEADATTESGTDISTVEFDDMKMKDDLPDELKYLDDESEDSLTEDWDNFKPGETKTFYFTTKIEGDERDRDGEFEKCVVNKASLYFDDDFQGSDDAVVCYKKDGDVLGTTTELPSTGLVDYAGALGAVMLTLGTAIKALSAKFSR